MTRLERENAELKRAKAILESALAFFAAKLDWPLHRSATIASKGSSRRTVMPVSVGVSAPPIVHSERNNPLRQLWRFRNQHGRQSQYDRDRMLAYRPTHAPHPGGTLIAATPDEILELVMDIERYAEVDDKIRPILWSRRNGDRLEFACRPKLAGLRQPAVVQIMTLTPGKRVDIELAPPPANRLARSVADFRASFECTPEDGGTRLVRCLNFEFTTLGRVLVAPLLRHRLETEVREELRRAKQALESPSR